MGTMEGHTQLAAVRPDMLAAWSYQSDIPGRLSRYQQTGDLRRRPRPLLEPATDIVGPRVYGARMTGESVDPRQRQALGALRYAVNEDAKTYLAIMRLFTSGMGGFCPTGLRTT